MSDINYSSNSNKSKEPEAKKPVEKVITGDAIIHKKSLGKKVRETFTVEDTSSVFEYLIFDVVIPSTKALLLDLVNQGLERKFYGTGTRSSSGSYISRGSSGRMTNYSKVSTKKAGPGSDISKRDRENHTFDRIVIETRPEAELVLDKLTDQIETYESASVADLYSALGHTPDFTDYKWGWTDIRTATVRPTRGGYILILPKTQPLD